MDPAAKEETCEEHRWATGHVADRLMEMGWVKMREQASSVPEPWAKQRELNISVCVIFGAWAAKGSGAEDLWVWTSGNTGTKLTTTAPPKKNRNKNKTVMTTNDTLLYS